MTLAELLPPLNATLNGTAALLLVGGRLAVARGNRALHGRLMGAAFVTSALFLASYLTRFALTGTTRFPVEGGWKLAYFTVLFSHMLLAIPLVPLVLRTLWLAKQDRLEEHRRLVRFTWPIWLYVSATGVLVYFMLYQLPALLQG